MGDGVAGMTMAGHRTLQPVQHLIDAFGEFVELIARAAHLGPGAEITVAHSGDDVVQGAHAARDVAADQQAAGQAQHDYQGAGAPEGADDLDHIGLVFADIGADEQYLAPAQPLLEAAGRMLHQPALGVIVGDREAGPRWGAVGVFQGRLGDRSGYARAVWLHQQVEERPFAGGPLDQRLVDRIDPGPVIGGHQRAHFARDVLVGATRRLAGGRQIDVGQKGAGRRGEQRQEQQGQSERSGSEKPGQAHGVRRALRL